MDRLKQQKDPVDPTERRAVALLNAVAPLSESRLRMRRVRLALDRAPRGRLVAVLRPAVVAGVLLGGIATAGATWGVVQLVTATDETVAAPVTVTGRPATPAVHRTRGPSQAKPPAAPVAVDVEFDEARPAVDEEVKTPAVKRRPAPQAVVAASPGTAAEVATSTKAHSDSILVHDAVKALRNGGDAAQAAELLKSYRAKNPQGVLAEEALALSIEAAVQNHDDNARQLARQYLAKYPNGRFVAAARRAVR